MSIDTVDFQIQEISKFAQKMNKRLTSRERPKSALYLRLKIVKGDPLDFVKLQSVAKYEKKMKGGPLGDF